MKTLVEQIEDYDERVRAEVTKRHSTMALTKYQNGWRKLGAKVSHNLVNDPLRAVGHVVFVIGCFSTLALSVGVIGIFAGYNLYTENQWFIIFIAASVLTLIGAMAFIEDVPGEDTHE